MKLNEIIKEKTSLIDNALKKYVKSENNAQNDIYEAMGYSLFAGGKRLRPLLMLLVCKMCGGDEQKALPFACALEMIHTYSLIHDDLPAMDNDDTRRGKPTSHKVYGEAMAILAGDALLNKAAETALSSKLPPEVTLAAMKALFSASGTDGMIGGQVIDIKNSELTKDELENLHLLKTGALIRSAGIIGATVAGAKENEINAVDEYCKNLGIAFQICDDILDVEGDERELGKPVGSDAQNVKTTYVTVFGLEKAKSLLFDYTKKAEDALLLCFGEENAEDLIQLAERLLRRKI